MTDGHLAWEPMTCWLPETDDQRPMVFCAITSQLMANVNHLRFNFPKLRVWAERERERTRGAHWSQRSWCIALLWDEQYSLIRSPARPKKGSVECPSVSTTTQHKFPSESKDIEIGHIEVSKLCLLIQGFRVKEGLSYVHFFSASSHFRYLERGRWL